MRTELRRLAAVLSLATWSFLLSTPAPARAQTADDLFNAQTLQEVRLNMNAADLALLREHFMEDTYYPADMQWGDVTVRNIGIRSRGSGSRNPTKPGLKLDFNEFVKGQTFLGFKDLVLDNLWQDPAMLREHTSMAFFNRLGQPAPREVFIRFYINNDYQGVFALVEPVDELFLKRTIDDDSGYLFDFEWIRNFYGEDLGEDYAPYREMFKPDTHDKEPDNTIYQPVHFLFREVNAQDDAGWENRVGQFLDLRQFVTQVAIETFLAERDGLLGDWGMNNFYLYRPEKSRQHRVFPWDKDNTFQAVDASIVDRLPQNAIMRRAMEQENLRRLYLQVLEDCARSALQDDWLVNRIAAGEALLTAAAHEDPRKPVTNAEFDTGMAFLKDFAARRPAYVLEQLAIIRGERPPDEPPSNTEGVRALALPRLK